MFDWYNSTQMEFKGTYILRLTIMLSLPFSIVCDCSQNACATSPWSVWAHCNTTCSSESIQRKKSICCPDAFTNQNPSDWTGCMRYCNISISDIKQERGCGVDECHGRKCTMFRYLCRLPSIYVAAHRDFFVWCLSVCVSFCPVVTLSS